MQGLPPNLRYFEYKTVLTANAGTGVITFTTELQNAYDSRWWDTANYGGRGVAFGAPRILSLQRSNYTLPQLVWLRGGTYLPNANGTAEMQTPADVVIYEDVTAKYIAPTTTNRFYCKRCNNIGWFFELDKLIDFAVIEDSVVDTQGAATSSITQAWGVNNLSIIRTKLIGGKIQVAPRRLVVADSDITPSPGQYQGITTPATPGADSIRTLSVSNTRIHNTGQTYAVTNMASPGLSLTVGSVSGTDILVPFDTTGKQVARGIDYGMTLTNTVTGNTGVITGIYYDSGSPGNQRWPQSNAVSLKRLQRSTLLFERCRYDAQHRTNAAAIGVPCHLRFTLRRSRAG